MTQTMTSPVRTPEAAVSGAWTPADDGVVYTISNYDHMPPFFMNVVSDTDTWLFISSNGPLTAGRVDSEHAILPYETDDKLHRAAGTSGPVTLLRVTVEGSTYLWEPFTGHTEPDAVTRRVSKPILGNRVSFEETHHALGLTFVYTWAHADRFGIVRTAALRNDSGDTAEVEWLDGLLSVLPAGPLMRTTQSLSCLINAYTRCEYLDDAKLGLFTMQSQLTDRAEPAESLTANVCWHTGLDDADVFLGAEAVDAFRLGERLRPEAERKGRQGSYLLRARRVLEPGASVSWRLVLDAALSQVKVADLHHRLSAGSAINAEIDAELVAGDDRLRRYLASADALQSGADETATAHHVANVLFNVMRGGVFADGYGCPGSDVSAFVQHRNPAVWERHRVWLGSLSEQIGYDRLAADAAATGDVDLMRLIDEYLPLHFGRRHGDPSRPWNQFHIHVRDEHGNRRLSYQGNWRDIFQNWEALLLSYPEFIEPVIAKFVNASTADGHNPYRVTRDGIDWEVPEPQNPWANIGYWGDHQIIYLCKLLEWSRRFHPGRLEALLNAKRFTYADVPYRIKPYEALVANPQDTVVFDAEHEQRIQARCRERGSDGRLVHDAEGNVLHVTLAEKLLVPILAKLSNLVPGGGIWMNTQRPEWNDANNALVGHGVSMVTLCYLRRHLALCKSLFAGAETLALSPGVHVWLQSVAGALHEHRAVLGDGPISAVDRRAVLDAVGRSFDAYRASLYADGLFGQTDVPRQAVDDLIVDAMAYLDHAIRVNRRSDGLYHAYNLLRFADETGVELEHLYEMLEGQVAVLSSGVLNGEEAVAVVDALFASPLYRADQDSFMLYPDRPLAGFLEKNIVPAASVAGNPLLVAMLEAGDTRIVLRDAKGDVRFNHRFKNAEALTLELDELTDDPKWAASVAQCHDNVLDLYETVFRHHAFTGRSGGMYGYEGLGCIYWHMISKLLLAVQENVFWAKQRGESVETMAALIERYRRVRNGLGFTKPPQVYGSFPTDPYSHTPKHAGAQQPGMTGQVKEEILTRFGEVGLTVADGCVTFDPILIDHAELHDTPTTWTFVAFNGEEKSFQIPADAIAFTFAQTPVVCRATSRSSGITVHTADGASRSIAGLTLDPETSHELFARTGRVARIEVELPVALNR